MARDDAIYSYGAKRALRGLPTCVTKEDYQDVQVTYVGLVCPPRVVQVSKIEEVWKTWRG